MYFPRSALVATGITSAAQGISLSNFTPRIENLPQQCQAVYTTQIAGCIAGDFSGGARCSEQCVNGLVDVSKEINTACRTVDVPETSIIGVFLLGQGIPALCAGVVVTTINDPGATYTSVVQQTTEAQASSTEAAQTSSGGIVVDTSNPAPSSPPSSTLATSVGTESAAAPQPPTTAAAQPQSTLGFSRSSTAKSTQTASNQKSNSESGGGSPFDIQSTGAASSYESLLPTTSSLALAVALLLCAFI